VAALQNTRKSAADRMKRDGWAWSDSYSEVCRAVDREMDERDRAERAEAERAVARRTTMMMEERCDKLLTQADAKNARLRGYITHWEGRTERAEAENAKLRDLLARAYPCVLSEISESIARAPETLALRISKMRSLDNEITEALARAALEKP